MSDGAGDATRRTFLANERTYLAWWRTGITALTVALAAARIVPELGDVAHRWPYTVLGVGYALAGLGCMGYGAHRRRTVERAVADGGWAPLPAAAANLLSAAGVLLALATVAVMLVDL